MIALAYYSLGVTILLGEYLRESSRMMRGMFLDTYRPLAFPEVISWPSSIFVANWNGYPERLDQAEWQSTLNDSVPSHIWAVIVQTIVIFLIITAFGMASGLKRSKRPRADGDS
ncbi:MAG TPA: hypothetical protein VGX49_08440 [Jatrophihabitans sp.]|nr:hypothetical protein [Jatrophihabitans sp.]